MNILITSASRDFPKTIASVLRESHHVRLTDRVDVSTDLEFERSDLGHDGSTNELVRGLDIIIHSGELSGDMSVSDQLDYHTRCTYNLLWAAWEEKVTSFIYLSSLSIMGQYDHDLAVTETWRPMPSIDPSQLCYHLGEYVCKEFAREHRVEIACLRLGDIIYKDDVNDGNTSVLHVNDAVHAVDRCIKTDLSPIGDNGLYSTYRQLGQPYRTLSYWNIFHIQSPVPNARFLTDRAKQTLGFKPSYEG